MKKKTNNEPSKKSLWCAIILWIIVIACWIVYFCISSNTLDSNNETEMIIDENTQELISEENDTLADIWETSLTEEEIVNEEEQVVADPDVVVGCNGICQGDDCCFGCATFTIVDVAGRLTDCIPFGLSVWACTLLSPCSFSQVVLSLDGVRLRLWPNSEDLYVEFPFFTE